MGFTSLDNFYSEITAGKFWRNDWIKLYNGATATVGNWYDLSQGAGNPIQCLHGNLVINYDFVTSQQPWIITTANWAYTPATHLMTRTPNADYATSFLYQTLRMTRGVSYQVVYTLGGVAGTGITVSLGGTAGTTRTTNATFKETIICGSTDKNITFSAPSATGGGTIDLVSVKAINGGFVPYNDLTEGAMWHGGDTPAGDTKHLVNFAAFSNAAAGVPAILQLVDVLGVYPHARTNSAAVQYLHGADAHTRNSMTNGETPFNEQVISNVTSSIVNKVTEGVTGGDDEHLVCAKLAITDTFTTGIICSKAVALATQSYNYVQSKYVYIWVRASRAMAAGDLSWCTDESANLASSQDVLLPALSANVWTKVRLDVSGQTGTDKDTVISVGFKAVNDVNATYNLYFDDAYWANTDGVLYNGNFAGNATGWTAGTANWAYRSNDVERTANADLSTFTQDLLPVTSKCEYRITYTIANRSAGGVTVSLGGTSGTQRVLDGTYEEIIVCGTTNYTLAFTPDATFNGRISHVICTALIPRCDAATAPTAYGGGVRMYYVIDGLVGNGANASTAILKYTNQAGEDYRSLGATVNNTASDAAYHLPHSGVGAGKFGPFLPMQGGDYGIQSVDSIQFSAAQATADAGVDIVVCKSIASIPITTIYVESERDLMNQLPSLPHVRDGACLMFLLHTGGATVAGTGFMGYCEFAWS